MFDHSLLKNRTPHLTLRKMTGERKTWTKTITWMLNLGGNAVLLFYDRPGWPVNKKKDKKILKFLCSLGN